MKKIIIIATVSLLMASCKKNYTCVCRVSTKTTTNGVLVKSDSKDEVTSLGKQRKTDAQKACSKMDGQTSTGTIGDGIVVDKICDIREQ